MLMHSYKPHATSDFERVVEHLATRRYRWLITGGAGFIGSHLLETLLQRGQCVVTLDNLSTGSRDNLERVRASVGAAAWIEHRFIEGDIRSLEACREACRRIDFVLHQAAVSSVPRSIADPVAAHAANASGFVNVLAAAKDAGVKRIVYAGSSAVYGDSRAVPNVEHALGMPLSPYAASKYANELYAAAFARCYGLQTIGLRYFNVFGPRQDPNGPYAAVIAKWLGALLSGEQAVIYGDGQTTRDYCYIANVVQANLLAAMTHNPAAVNQVYNVAFGGRTSLNELFVLLRAVLMERGCAHIGDTPLYKPFRAGDIPHSLADIAKARTLLGYRPAHSLHDGLRETVAWFMEERARQTRAQASTALG